MFRYLANGCYGDESANMASLTSWYSAELEDEPDEALGESAARETLLDKHGRPIAGHFSAEKCVKSLQAAGLRLLIVAMSVLVSAHLVEGLECNLGEKIARGLHQKLTGGDAPRRVGTRKKYGHHLAALVKQNITKECSWTHSGRSKAGKKKGRPLERGKGPMKLRVLHWSTYFAVKKASKARAIFNGKRLSKLSDPPPNVNQ